jgi:hypothetical protein
MFLYPLDVPDGAGNGTLMASNQTADELNYDNQSDRRSKYELD